MRNRHNAPHASLAQDVAEQSLWGIHLRSPGDEFERIFPGFSGWIDVPPIQ
jgi:hypothetical protein